MSNIVEILDIAYLGLSQETKGKMLSLWRGFDECMTYLMHIDDLLDLQEQSAKLQEKATAFGKLFSELLPAASGGVYLHILVCGACVMARAEQTYDVRVLVWVGMRQTGGSCSKVGHHSRQLGQTFTTSPRALAFHQQGMRCVESGRNQVNV